MRKILPSVILLTFMSTALCSCGIFQAYEIADISETAETSEITEEEIIEEVTESVEDDTLSFQECHKTIKNPKKPEVVKFSFLGECTDNIKKYVSVKDIYDTNYLHNGVVGLVGVPFELTYGKEINTPAISFTYNKDELR